jgi:hypothetical protein
LIPPTPLSCPTCPRCHGAGYIERRGERAECICYGLGWIEFIEDEAGEKDSD